MRGRGRAQEVRAAGEHSPWGGEAGNLPESGSARKYVALPRSHISSKFNMAGRLITDKVSPELGRDKGVQSGIIKVIGMANHPPLMSHTTQTVARIMYFEEHRENR